MKYAAVFGALLFCSWPGGTRAQVRGQGGSPEGAEGVAPLPPAPGAPPKKAVPPNGARPVSSPPRHAPTRLSEAEIRQREVQARAARVAQERAKERAIRRDERRKMAEELFQLRKAWERRRKGDPKPKKAVPPVRKKQGLSLFSNGFRATLSGMVQLHSIFSSESSFMVESPLRVCQESKGSTNVFSARASKFRVDIGAPQVLSFSPSGVFEIDFYGNLPASSTSVRQSQVRMRLAYVQLKRGDLTLRFGNDWMVAAPQFASTLQPFNLWGQGNLWMRYPQVKANYLLRFAKRHALSLDLSVGEDMGGDAPKNTMLRNGGMGENAAIPLVQGRLAYRFNLGEAEFSEIGLSGSWQRLDLNANTELTPEEQKNVGDHVDSWFGAADAQFRMRFSNVKLKLTGEFHYGQGIGMYWGGILQSFDYRSEMVGGVPVKQEIFAIKSMGYFVDLNLLFPCGVGIYGGHGRNSVDEDDLFAEGSVVKNQTFYGGLTLKRGSLFFGLGGTYMRTDYMANPNTRDAFMVETVARFTF